MQRPHPETVTLNDILITEELSRRSPYAPKWQAQAEAMQRLIHQMAQDSETLLQTLVDTALELCEAGTTGVSLLETTPDGEGIFRWNALAGTLAQHVGGSTPRNFSPCGVCLEQGGPVLFSHPERYFTYFQEANTLIVEGLVLPLVADHHIFGTIWIMSHDEQRHFDSEDVRVMTSLADFTATTLRLKQYQMGELLVANAALEAEIVERRQAEERSRALISNLPGGAAFVVDRDLRYLLAEGEALAIAGFKPEDLVGHTIFEVLPLELVTSYEPIYRKALAGEPFEHEHHAHNHTYVSRGIPLRSADGEVYAVLAVSYDITDRKRTEEALRASEAQIAADLVGMRRLYELHAKLSNETNLHRALNAIVTAAAEFMGTNRGCVQLVSEDGKRLEMFAYQGYSPDARFIQHLLHEGSKPACDAGHRTQRRLIIEDVENFPPLLGTRDREVALADGIRATQSTPIISRKGELLGVLSTQFPRPHRSSDNELRLIDLLAWTAADFIERHHSNAQLRRAAELNAFRVELSDALRSLTDSLEIQAEACRILGEHLGVDRAYYVEVNEVESYARVNQDYLRSDSPSLVGTFRLVDYGWIVPHLRRGETIIVTDADNADIIPEAERAAMVVVRIASHITIPLVKAGVLVGALCVTEAKPRQWSEAEIELVRETAERIWAAIERAYAEAALRKSEEQFRTFITASSDIIYKMSADWHEMRNLEGKNILASTENPSQTWIEIYIPQAEQQRVWTAIQAAIRTKSTFELEHQVIQQDGSIGWTFSRAIPILNEQGEILEWFGAASDLTARKQAEANQIQLIREQAAREEERQRAEALAELDRAKTLFFSNVSHEFRTPLTLSLAPLQDALSDRNHALAPIHRERLELVHRNSLRLLKLVNTLLDFSRIEAGRMEAVYEPVDLAMFTTELASVFRSALKRAGLQLIVDCPPLPKPVFVDREMWEKIVLNLLSNAFKFTFTGEIRVSLHLTNGNQALLQIQDTGIGIAPKHLPHLFERFYQVRGTQARTHEGSGIGLALVHELVRLHGGTIEVSSTLGEGTCFTVSLPFGTGHLPSDRLQDEGDRVQPIRTLASTAMGAASYVEEAERWLPQEEGETRRRGDKGSIAEEFSLSPSTPYPQREPRFPRLPLIPRGGPEFPVSSSSARVLLVDDNADMREYLTRILSKHVQVEAVADGATALTVAQERVPDLILSDVMMPGLDGFELLGALRADSRTREVPIILLSARAGEEAIVEGLQAGADDYLIKPFSAQELVSRVNTHLQMAQLRKEALQEARNTIRSRDELISVVSHELNTPLVSILGWTRLLRSNPPSPAVLTKALDTIERNAVLQGKLVQDLLDISRISAGKLRLNPQPVELKSVIETAITTVTQTATEKGVHLTWQKNATDSIVVMGDGDRLQQVICNLLTNAIKFTPASGSITVELSIVNDHPNTAHAVIRVTDTGIGIAANFLPHVFDRFRQARDADSVKGLGLGLAIARHLVELHHGTIHAESAGEGQGATFIVKLPLFKG